MFRFLFYLIITSKIARYQQYYAISAIIESISHYEGASRKGGLIWHTQGSGKSLTMVMATMYLQKNRKC